MIILITGDRHWSNKLVIRDALTELVARYGKFTLIHGAAKGVDTIAGFIGKYAFNLDVVPYPADWTQYGKPAGRIRNRQMLIEGKPDLVVAFHNDLEQSKGTKHMLEIAGLALVPRIWYTEEGKQYDERTNDVYTSTYND